MNASRCHHCITLLTHEQRHSSRGVLHDVYVCVCVSIYGEWLGMCVFLSWCERISSLAPLSLTDRVTETLLIQH